MLYWEFYKDILCIITGTNEPDKLRTQLEFSSFYARKEETNIIFGNCYYLFDKCK